VVSSSDAEAKQNASGAQDPAIGELDQEVIDGILKRFEIGEEEKDQELREANDGDDQRG
jgi:hypothetical protein